MQFSKVLDKRVNKVGLEEMIEDLLMMMKKKRDLERNWAFFYTQKSVVWC